MIAYPAPSSNDIPAESEPIPAKPSKYQGFTAESAAAMRERKRIKLESLKAQAEAQKQATQLAKLLPQPADPVLELDAFTFRRLTRIREQLDLVDKEVKRCLLSADPADHAKLKPLVECSSRLSEQERFAANRPGPGTRKPQAERKSRGPSLTVCAEDVD